MSNEKISVDEVRDIDPSIGIARLVDGDEVPLSRVDFIGETLVRPPTEESSETDQ